MNFGVPELVLLVMVFGLAFLVLTVYACIRASQNGDTGWVVGILAGWFLGAGWLVGLVYLLAVDRPRQLGRPASAMPPPVGTPAPPPTQPAGWYTDPSGRFELRYWDGRTWTDNVSRAGHQSTDPATP